MGKNKLYQRKENCFYCGGKVIHNQTHHLTYCPCEPPTKEEIPQSQLDAKWTVIKDHRPIAVILHRPIAIILTDEVNGGKKR